MSEAGTTITSVSQVLDHPPLIHGWDPGEGVITHGLIRPALEFIESTVKPDWRTLETGSGLSTIAFAMTGSEHLVIVPNAEEEIDELGRNATQQRMADRGEPPVA